MPATAEEKRLALELAERGRADYSWYMTHVLDVNPEHCWSKMREVNDSVRDNSKTAVGAGHGVSKTYVVARIALTFLRCHYPSTVITTAPSWHQVKSEMWREIRQSHANAHIPFGGNLTTTMLDLQVETGVKWFAFGVATKPDTVTLEATKLMGHHNVHMLKIIDEAAGVHPEIWRALRYCKGDFDRTVAIGNAVTAAGEFAAALKDPTWNHINISVLDTPNFKTGRRIIPGVFGREEEMECRLKYGVESDEYRVRMLGLISQKRAEGAYYANKIAELRKKGRIGVVLHDPNYAVHIVRDAGYTSAFWFFQMIGSNVRFIRYYEDSGPGVEDFVRVFDEFKKECGYHYGQDFVPFDMSSNAQRVVTGQTAYETLQALGLNPTKLPLERTKQEGIDRTRRFLSSCWFDEELCKEGIEHLESYHEEKNKLMSTEDKPVFTGVPAKDGHQHGADAMRYASKAVPLVGSSSRMTAEESKELWAKHRRS